MSPRARILFVALMLLIAATCVRLGLWQRSRLLGRRTRNAAAVAARALPPLTLGATDGVPLADRRVIAHGTFDHANEMLLRQQVLSGSPGVVVVTPLRESQGDSAVLVIRGFLPSADGLSVPQLDSLGEEGERTISGVARPIANTFGRGQPLLRAGQVSWHELELGALRARLPYALRDVVIFPEPAPGDLPFPRRLDLPPLDDGPHLSYMLQWFGFATIAAIMALLAVVRRRVAGWSEPTAAAPSAAAPPPPPRP